MTVCGWCGLPCDCTEFPYKIGGFIPMKCEQRILYEMPHIITVRSVRDKDAKKWIALAKKNVTDVNSQ